MLDASQERHFREHGYVVLRQVISPASLRRLRGAVEDVLAAAAPGDPDVCIVERGVRKSIQVQHAYRKHVEIERFARESGLAAVAGSLMGSAREVRLWFDQVIWKPSGRGGPVNWHQDYFYWQRAQPPDMVTSWTALDVSDKNSGCVWFMSGSHKWGLLDNAGDVGINPVPHCDPEHLVKTAAAQGFLLVPEPAVLQPGDVSFHHCLVLHGSSDNCSNHDRAGYVQSYMNENARHREFAWSANQDDILVPIGQTLSGPTFPLLWRAQ
jgi:ectoine hydroxylase-related dioxygenase (phytanoyl-CoA dioxygenase family)